MTWDTNRFTHRLETPSSSSNRLPRWLRRSMPKGRGLLDTVAVLGEQRLSTVCEESRCPNLPDCWSRKTATFLALGSACTRSCGFCDIDFAKNPPPPEGDEPQRIATSAKQLGLEHVVVTMVARDDLPDQGAGHIAHSIQEIRKAVPKATIEVLTSDFSGSLSALDHVLAQRPHIYNHNIETVERLTPRVRHRATYHRTLQVLRHAKQQSSSFPLWIKSGIMVGLGEKEREVYQTIEDLYQAGCQIITMGQYLQPSKNKLRVKEFVTPEQFKKYEAYGHKIGVHHMYCGPFVRSSYNAQDVLRQAQHKKSVYRCS